MPCCEEARRVVGRNVSWCARGTETAVRPTSTWREARDALLTRLDTVVHRHPQALALSDGPHTLTYGDMWKHSAALAARLAAAGVRPGQSVGLYGSRSAESVLTMVALFRLGAVCVPLDRTYPVDRLAMMADDGAVGLMVTDGASAVPEDLSHLPALRAVGGDGPADAVAGPAADAPLRPDLCYLVYTSGSTGRPKAIALPYWSLENLVSWQIGDSRATRGTRTAHFAPLSVDVSYQELLTTFGTGGHLVVVADEVKSDPERLWRLILDSGIERLFIPFVALQILALFLPPQERLAQARLTEVIVCGEPLRCSPDIREMFARMPRCVLTNQYGTTETHVVTAHHLGTASEEWPDLPPIGRPISSVTATLEPLTPAAGDPAPDAGELLIGGMAAGATYLRRPGLTAEKFVPDPALPGGRMYRTGDLVTRDADGVLHFLGRNDDQVKIRGYRVELGEVEVALSRLPGVRQATVVAAGSESMSRFLVAFVVGDVDTGELADSLRRRLPDYLVPSMIQRVDAFPTTGYGKVDRRRLLSSIGVISR
ncbi:AMP-binding protein [Actinomadura fulvescens]